MKLSINELKKYVDLNDKTLVDIADKLTYSGIEVESISSYANASNLVIGKVISCISHPDSDHLHICKVDIGTDILQIVCGAPNVKEGEKVIVAKVGAVLPKLTIKQGVIRGIESNGMLCSLLELGVESKYLTQEQINGIELLPEDAPIGEEKVLEYLGIDDSILDLKLLANRPDCYSIFNVAKEVASLYKINANFSSYDISKIKVKNDDFEISIKTDSCFKFNLRTVHGINVSESPKWLKNILNSSGIRSINSLVDIGNYVMLLTGQPLHIYDIDTIKAKNLTIKDGFETSFEALDSKTYQIEKNDIVICSDSQIECLAGIMGSFHSETTMSTKNIAIESAIFDSKTIRLTSLRLGLASESSARFIKGINKFNQTEAINIAIYLINELCGIEYISELKECSTKQFEQTKINCSYSYINSRLGTDFSKELIKETLEGLNISIKDINDDEFEADIPLFRIDITSKADLSEEVIRILGFKHITSKLPRMNVAVGGFSENKVKENIVSSYLVNSGLYKIVTYSLVNKKQANELPIFNKHQNEELLNPLTDDHSIVRQNLIPSMLSCISYNANHKQNDFSLFEFSNVYGKDFNEKHLCIGLYGNYEIQGLLCKIPFDFYSVKKYLMNIMEIFGIEESRYSLVKIEEDNKYFHPGKTSYVYIGKELVGVIGELHPYIRKEYDIKDNCAIMEINFSYLCGLRTKQIISKEISKFPAVDRDLALIVEDTLPVSNLISCIKKALSSYNTNVNIFDIYKGENVGIGLKSVALRITIEPNETTLKEEEITTLMNKVISELANKFKAKLR